VLGIQEPSAAVGLEGAEEGALTGIIRFSMLSGLEDLAYPMAGYAFPDFLPWGKTWLHRPETEALNN
jgi:hypothetical protein